MIVKAIKAKMAEKHISQNEMALRIGVTNVTMSRWMQEQRYPTIDHVEAMARELDCDIKLVETPQ